VPPRRARALLVVLGVALAGCGGHTAVATTSSGDPTTQGAMVFQGNFSDPSQEWPMSSGSNPSESASGDTYSVTFNSAGAFDASPTIATVQPQNLANVSVSVSVTPSNVRSGDRFGVMCRNNVSDPHSYAFFVGPQSSGQLAWSIQLRRPEGVRQLASGTTAAPGSSPYTLRGDCINGGPGHQPVVLALYLGGSLVGQAQDAKLPAPFGGRPGLVASSAAGGTSVDFSNFQVRAASAS
jgi:hypothetical protein